VSHQETIERPIGTDDQAITSDLTCGFMERTTGNEAATETHPARTDPWDSLGSGPPDPALSVQ